jgi:hypothetical protein
MKRIILPLLALGQATLFLLSGCSKGHPPVPPPADSAKLCRVTSILTDTRGLIYGDTAAPTPVTITSDAAGNPVEWRTQGGVQVFRYDNKARLTDVISHSTGTPAPDGWSRYSYPSADKLVDSFFTSQGDTSTSNLPSHPGDFQYADNWDLDAKGRPVKIVRTFPPGSFPSSTSTYAYDSSGNLTYPNLPGTVYYDNKINVFRTSRTWQILYRDFSMNNAHSVFDANMGAAEFNAYGLPTKFNGPLTPFASFSAYFTVMYITYSCDAPSLPKGY